MLTEIQIKIQRDRWQRNKAASRERAELPKPSLELIAYAVIDAERRLSAACKLILPDDLAPRMRAALTGPGAGTRAGAVPGGDLYSLWYEVAHNPQNPLRDLPQLSSRALGFTAAVWAARTLIEHQRGFGNAKAGRIATWLRERSLHHGYTKGSLRVMVDRALERIKRIEAVEGQLSHSNAHAAPRVEVA